MRLLGLNSLILILRSGATSSWFDRLVHLSHTSLPNALEQSMTQQITLDGRA